MVKFKNLTLEAPYFIFNQKYSEAIDAGQECIEAMSIASFDKSKNEVSSRFVNLKFIINNEFIFFSNYESPKSKSFKSHNQISASFFWSSTNTQIRMLANINKTSKKFNNDYFSKRSEDKNALAICSAQSEEISSYKNFTRKYNKIRKNENLSKCPDYWGGFSFIPFYFEFWEGHESRINKRKIFKKNKDHWDEFILQP